MTNTNVDFILVLNVFISFKFPGKGKVEQLEEQYDEIDEENDDDLDFDPDLAASGFSVGEIESLEDPMFGDDL